MEGEIDSPRSNSKFIICACASIWFHPKSKGHFFSRVSQPLYCQPNHLCALFTITVAHVSVVCNGMPPRTYVYDIIETRGRGSSLLASEFELDIFLELQSSSFTRVRQILEPLVLIFTGISLHSSFDFIETDV